MIVDVGDTLQKHWLKILVSSVSLFGTSVGGAYWSLDRRIDTQATQNTAVIATLQEDITALKQNTSEIKGTTNTILTLMKNRK
jgi:hypothetical protein